MILFSYRPKVSTASFIRPPLPSYKVRIRSGRQTQAIRGRRFLSSYLYHSLASLSIAIQVYLSKHIKKLQNLISSKLLTNSQLYSDPPLLIPLILGYLTNGSILQVLWLTPLRRNSILISQTGRDLRVPAVRSPTGRVSIKCISANLYLPNSNDVLDYSRVVLHLAYQGNPLTPI